MSPAMPRDDYFRELEEALLDPEVRSDPAAVGRLLADDFREFGSSGAAFGRDEVIAALSSETPSRRTMTDFAVRTLGADFVLVTYRAERTDADGTMRNSLRSSVWRRGETGWRMTFHQGTPAARKPAFSSR